MNRVKIIFIVLIIVNIIRAQGPDSIQFVHYETENNPAFQYISSINLDHSKNIWISSLRGLFRFDGYRTHLYVNDPNDSHSLIDNRVLNSFLSRDNQVWILTGMGFADL